MSSPNLDAGPTMILFLLVVPIGLGVLGLIALVQGL